MSDPTLGTPPESDRTGPTAPRTRALAALRELDAELAHLSRTARSGAELHAALADLLASTRAATPHADGTTTLVVDTAAWLALRTAGGRTARRPR